MVADDHIARSRAIQRRTGKTFHVATRLLPAEVRQATYVLYAFFRVADEVVDDPNPAPPGERRQELDRMRRAALGEIQTDHPVLSAFQEVRESYGIPDQEVERFIASMETDVGADTYRTYDELTDYLRGSAVAVGNMMLHVLDPEEFERARPHARALGQAFQLTNVLRDVREDVTEFDRIYLPEESLERHGLTPAAIRDLEFSEAFADVVRDELRRTEALYREGVAGIQYLPDNGQFAVLLSAVLYADHHRLIRNRHCDVLTRTPRLPRRRRISLATQTWVHWQRDPDPTSVFYRVTDLSRDPVRSQAVSIRPEADSSEDRSPLRARSRRHHQNVSNSP